jgi:hypothetical protein
MRVDPRIVTELREMFLNGATPSRLVRHIAVRHEGDQDWPTYVEPYFAEAFSVTTFAMVGHSAEVDLDRTDLSGIDVDLLRDMVGRKAAWRESADHISASAWCDGLTVSPDDLAMNDKIRPESHPALTDSWESMKPRAREFVRQAMVNAQGYYERMEVFVRLSEQLQKRIIELEAAESVRGHCNEHTS